MPIHLSRRGRSGLFVPPPPPAADLPFVVGASVNYAGYPGITDGGLQADMAVLEGRIRTLLGVTGNSFAGPHGYSGNSWPATFAQSAVGFAPAAGYSRSFLNVKTGGSPSFSSWANWAAGGWDSHCTNYVASVPSGHTHYFTTDHEGENDKDGYLGQNYGGPDDDGGAFEAVYADQHARGSARMANIVAAMNRPEVWYCWVPMVVTFPANGQLGSLGIKSRDPEKWNPFKYMTPEARRRTILAPDAYTDMQSGGTSESIIAKFGRVLAYNSDAGWGAELFGAFEHTLNNDAMQSDAAVAAAWHLIFDYFESLGDIFKCYVTYSSSGPAAGDNGWTDHTNNGAQPYTAKLTAFAQRMRTINFGSPPGGGSGITVRAVATPTEGNNAAPAIVIPGAGQGVAANDYALVQYGGTSTRTPTDPSGWTVLVSQDSSNERARWYLKKLVAGDLGATLSIPLDGTTRWFATCVVYTGVHLTTPLDGSVDVDFDNLSQTGHTAGSATSTGAGRMVVSAVWQRSGSIGGVNTGTSAWGAPAGFTPRSAQYAETLPGSSGAIADLANQGAGTVGPLTWTSDVAIGNFVGATLALIPA